MDQMRFTMAGREAGQEDLGARRAERLIEEVEDFGGRGGFSVLTLSLQLGHVLVFFRSTLGMKISMLEIFTRPGEPPSTPSRHLFPFCC